MQAQEAQMVPNKMDPKKPTPRHIIIKMPMVKNKERMFFFNLFIFRERGREGEIKGQKHQCLAASHMALTRDPACNPGTCPDWESNLQPLGSQACTQSTEPHQPGAKRES